jgi:hypothetical protein
VHSGLPVEKVHCRELGVGEKTGAAALHEEAEARDDLGLFGGV